MLSVENGHVSVDMSLCVCVTRVPFSHHNLVECECAFVRLDNAQLSELDF